MSATPTKKSKRGRKKKDHDCNRCCRFCDVEFVSSSGTRASFENLFKKSTRGESPGTVLAECCSSIGFPLIQSESLSERVCQSCGRKIRNASELYCFVKTAVTSTNAVAASATNCEAVENNQEDIRKRQLPTTITPERNKGKRRPPQDKDKDQDSGQRGTRKSLFSVENAATEIRSLVEEIEDDPSEGDNSHTQSADMLTSLCNIEDISETTSKQLKVLILYPNGDVVVRDSFDDTTKSLISNLALKNWKTAANLAFKHIELTEHNLEAVRMALSAEFKALSKCDTILKGRKPDEIAAFSNKVFMHELSVFCPLWYSCLKGACGITKANSAKKFTRAINVMALASAAVGRFRNSQLSAYAYRLSTILFHAGAKYDDVLRLNRLGVCMSPQSAVNLQRQMGENYNAKVLIWKKSIEQTVAALNMLEAVKVEQVPARGHDDMEITVEIHFDETTVRNNRQVQFDDTTYKMCADLLDIVRKRRNDVELNNEILEETIIELRGQEIPSYK